MVLSEPLNAPYTRLGAIDAPTDTVNALAFSVDGRLLASAGDDRRVRVYDMDRGFSTFWEHEGLCAFTAVAWSDSVLFMGNMDGKIITFHPTKKWIYRRKSEVLYKTNTPIECLEFDKHGNRLLVCSGADVLLFKNSMDVLESGIIRIICLAPVHSEKLRITAARQSWQRVLIFWEMMIVSWHIFTTDFGEKNKTMLYSLNTEDLMNRKFKFDAWENCRSWGPEEKIAAMVKSPDSTAVVTTNIFNGLSWFRSTPENVKKMGTSVDVQPRPQNIPLPVLFINKGQATIMGMTKGYVAIFEVKRGKRIQALKHGEGTFSQDVSTVFSDAYVELAGCRRMIASGEGNCGQRTRIVIWTQDEADGPSKRQKISKFWGALTRFIKFTTTVGHIVLILMGVIFAISWLYSAQWRERESANFLQYFGRSFIPPATTPPVVPSATPAGESPSLKKLKELLISLEDLLVCVGLSIGIQTN
ncbi:MAG: WD40-repeat-containing domain protein [Lentinula lateritia]|nr:MAG: WD40-repeat-containing domain protein [Lentinula lateritia]